MKKEIKKVTKKVAKKVTKVVVNYKELYESMKVFADNLSTELERKSDLSFERGAIIDELNERLEDAGLNAFLWSLAFFLIGLGVGLCF